MTITKARNAAVYAVSIWGIRFMALQCGDAWRLYIADNEDRKWYAVNGVRYASAAAALADCDIY